MTLAHKQTIRHGTTLVEILIVMGLMSGLMLTLATLFASSIGTQLESQSTSSLESNGRFIMARLDYDIARATAIRTPASLGATSTQLVITVGGRSYTYRIIGSDLRLTDNVGNVLLNGNDVKVSDLSTKWLGFTGDKQMVSYSFKLTTTTKADGVYDSMTFSNLVALR